MLNKVSATVSQAGDEKSTEKEVKFVGRDYRINLDWINE